MLLRTSKSHPSSSTFRFAVTPTSSQNARVAYCRGGRVHSPLSIVLPVPNCFFTKPYTVQTTSTQPLRRKTKREQYARAGARVHKVQEARQTGLRHITITAVTRRKRYQTMLHKSHHTQPSAAHDMAHTVAQSRRLCSVLSAPTRQPARAEKRSERVTRSQGRRKKNNAHCEQLPLQWFSAMPLALLASRRSI